MTYIKRIPMVVLILVFALIGGIASQLYGNTHTFAANTIPGTNEVIAIGGTTDGQPANATTYVEGYSGDGNSILFRSTATNFPNAGGSGGLYVYNIRNNSSTRADLSTNGVQPNGNNVGFYKISEAGRYITFASMATNLIDGSTTSQRMLYKRDIQTGTTTLVGGGYSGGLSQNWDRNLGVSNDGRFSLIASRYKANSYPYNFGIAIGEEVSGAYTWTSLGIDSNGIEGSSSSQAIVGELSCDGSFATFQKDYSIRLSDLRRGTIGTVSIGNGNSTSPIISCNGRYVLYATTNRSDIASTPPGMNASMHLVRYDRITGERSYIDSDSSGTFSSGFGYDTLSNPPANVFNASIADTGDVVFKYNGNTYLKHLSDGSGTLESIGKTSSGTYINIANGQITSDGRYIFFSTDPYNLGLSPSPSGSKIIRAKTGL